MVVSYDKHPPAFAIGRWWRHSSQSQAEPCIASPLAQRLIDILRLKRMVADWPKDGQAAERRKFELHLALDRFRFRGAPFGKFRVAG